MFIPLRKEFSNREIPKICVIDVVLVPLNLAEPRKNRDLDKDTLVVEARGGGDMSEFCGVVTN